MKDKVFYDVVKTITDDEVLQYFKKIGMSDKNANWQLERFKKNADIYEEFKYAFYAYKNGSSYSAMDFGYDEPITESGWNAYDLCLKFGYRLDRVEVCNTLIDLRENAKEKLTEIAKWKPRMWF